MKNTKWFLVSSDNVRGETHPGVLYAVRAESEEQAVRWVNPEREFEDHEMESVIEKGSIKYIGATLNAVLFMYVLRFCRERYGVVDLTVGLEIITGEINSPNFVNITVYGLPSSLFVAQITASMPFEQAEDFVKESGFTPYSESGENPSGIEYLYNYDTGRLRWSEKKMDKQTVEILIVSTELTEAVFTVFEDDSVDKTENVIEEAIQDEIKEFVAGPEWSHRTFYTGSIQVDRYRKK